MKNYEIRHKKNDSKNVLTGDGKLALGILIGVVFSIISTLFFQIYWGSPDSSYYKTTIPIIISLIVAAASTTIATYALTEQKKTREASTDPVLIAHLGQREDAREVITFNITNIGAGAALNILIDVDNPMKEDEEWDKRDMLTNVFKRHHPFSVLPQDKSIEFALSLGWKLLGQNNTSNIDVNNAVKPLPAFNVKLSYEDLEGGKYESSFVINVLEMQLLGANKSPYMRMVSALETIAKKQR